jgi:hypothetical protein
MATIRKREGRYGISYDVQIRLRSYKENRVFKNYQEAKRWAEKTELEMREGKYGIISESRKRTLSDAIERYRKYVLPEVKKSRRDHILDWWEKIIGRQSLNEITPALVTELRDKLLHSEIDGKKRAIATVVKYLATLSHILKF